MCDLLLKKLKHLTTSVILGIFLADNAYACDPRIFRFKEEEKERKAAQKRAKQDAARQRQEEEDKVGSEVSRHFPSWAIARKMMIGELFGGGKKTRGELSWMEKKMGGESTVPRNFKLL